MKFKDWEPTGSVDLETLDALYAEIRELLKQPGNEAWLDLYPVNGTREFTILVRPAALRPIKNDEEHQLALKEVQRLWDFPDGSPEKERLDHLSILIDSYEREIYGL